MRVLLAVALFGAQVATLAAEEGVPSMILGVYGHPQGFWDRGIRLDSCGVNAVFIHSGQLDQATIGRARAQGCAVFAEFATLNGAYGDYVSQHPEAHPVNAAGEPAPQAEWFMGVCPTDPGFRAWRMAELRHFLQEHAVDGVWMDYLHWHAQFEDPYPQFHKTCFNASCLSAFQAWARLTVPAGSTAEQAQWILQNAPRQWEDWRVWVLVDWAREFHDTVKGLRSGALVGNYQAAWKDEDLWGARRRCLGLDFEALRPYVDVFSPMPYHGRSGMPPAYVREYVEYFSQRHRVHTEPGKYPRLWPIVQAYDDPRVTPDELATVLEDGLSGRSSGVMMFTASSVAEDPGKVAAMARVYRAHARAAAADTVTSGKAATMDQSQGKRYTVENTALRMVLDSLGRVVEITNRRTGVPYVRPGCSPSSPFVVDVYRAEGPVTFQDAEEEEAGGFSMADPHLRLDEAHGELEHLTCEAAPAPQVQEERTGKARSLTFAYALPSAVTLVWSVSLDGDSPVAVWRVKVTNGQAERPQDRRRVYRVRFPVLPNLCLGDAPTHNFLARTLAQGELVPNPSQDAFALTVNWVNRDRPPLRTHLLTYPGWASMPWLDLYLKEPDRRERMCGLYLASYDPSLQQVDFVTVPQPQSETVDLRVQTLAYLEPGKEWQSQEFVTGVHDGDWHWGADRYRADSRAWLQPNDPPPWIRDCDGWFGTGGPNYQFRDLPRMLDEARSLGLDYLQCWSQMIEAVGPGRSRKPYYCFFLPDPQRGGEAALREGVAGVRARGGHIGFYSNVWTFDAELPGPLEQWRDQIPPDVTAPDWHKEFRGYGSVFADGHQEEGNYTDGYSGMCLAAEGYRRYLQFWIIDKYVKDYGVDAWYLDSCPVTMFNAARVCFSDRHGPAPHGVGRGAVELVRQLRQAAGQETHLAISTETISDVFMQYDSHALGIEMVAGFQHPRPEIYAYTFPDHIVFSGTCNGAGAGLVYYYPDMTAPRREDAVNQVFLMGFRFDILAYPLDQQPPEFVSHLRALIALRQGIKADLYAASFRDETGLGPRPDSVEARVFRRNDGGGLVVTLLDRRPQPQAFVLRVDLQPLAVTSVARATLHTLDGGQADVPLRRVGSHGVEVAVPARQGAPAALVLR
ncbi:MAG: DUF6259 domain-containing protein [Candidatus Latescibacterota bacterium]